MKYGYARVSTDGQSVDAQVRQLTKAGCKKVFREVASGAKTDRAQLRKLLDQLGARGQTLGITTARSSKVIRKEVRLSVTHFSRAFSRSFGEPPIIYMRRQRLKRAQRLMTTTDAPLADVAVDSGFGDQAYFTGLFRRDSWPNSGEVASADQRSRRGSFGGS
jgi:transcriptional regulator GlxA family with amidase domain